VDDVRDAVGRIRGDLPADLKDPQIARLNLSGAPILTYTVASSRLDDEALSWFVDNDITKALLSVNGVGSVARVGGVTREVQVALDPARLLALGATASDVSRQLRQVQQDAPGGRRRRGPRRAGRAHHRHGAVGQALAAWTSRCRRPQRAAGPWPPSPTPWPSGAAVALLTASRWWASRSPAAGAPARWRWTPPW
jgi:multidrug efflux pump subunit AcrB